MNTPQNNLILAYSRGFIQFLGSKETIQNRYYEEVKILIALFQKHSNWMLKFQQRNKNGDRQVFASCFAAPFAPGWKKFFALLFDDGNWWLLPAILQQIKALLATELKIQDGKVYSVIRLTSKQMQALITALSKRLSMRVELANYLDYHLIGGVVVEINQHYFDNSLRKRLQNLQHLFNQETNHEN